MIDIHCHILPGIDDGAESVEDAVEMARIASKDGTKILVATPHVNVSLLPPEEIADAVNRLNEELRVRNIDLTILSGADTVAHLDPEYLRRYTINGSDYVLLEFPHTHLPENSGDTVFRAQLAGLRPIITHPERNPSIMKDPRLVLNLVKRGALVQVTASSLTGGFGPISRECALYLLKKKAIHFLASDGHSPVNRRPEMSQGVAVAARILGAKAAKRLVEDNPAAVIAGERIHV